MLSACAAGLPRNVRPGSLRGPASPELGAGRGVSLQRANVPIHVDLKRAQKAAERGDQAEAAGQIEEALLHYQEAVHYAPRDERY